MASLLIRGFALGFAIAASPGPIFFLCLRRSLLRGWLTGLVSGLGVATADAFYAAVAVFGVAAVVTTTLAPVARWLALAGGLALVFIGIRAVVSSPATREATTSTTRTGLAWAYTSILGLTITNPATIISFAALAAALGAGLSGSWTRPALVVAGVGLGSTSWWLILAAITAALRARVTPTVARTIGIVSGLAIAALGAVAVVASFGK
ncbi:MAG: LysE family translocator [Chloroflexi bacterium]|nr:MAG: LysE family translocator [Chloroflexota bacterium]TME99969.1 MAG: LysE family translocator [Chloroflexota bacterium]